MIINIQFNQINQNMKTNCAFVRKKVITAGMIGYLAILFILFQWKEVNAQRSLPTTDPFDYMTGALQVVGQDWTRISGTSNDLLVTNGNVTYNGYLAATGRKATMTNGANDDLKLTFVSQSSVGTIVFMAFTMNVLNATGLTSSGTYCFILGSGSNNFAARIYIKSSGTGYLLGISKTSTAPSSWSSLLTVSSIHLIVMSYEIKSGGSNDVVSMWIDPAITTVQLPAGLSTSSGTDFGGGSAIDGFMLRQATGTPNVSIDDISISTNWSDLMKNPVYTSSGYIGSGNFNNLTLSGITTILTLNANISTNGTLTLSDANIHLNGNVLSYGSSGTLKYSGNTAQTTNVSEFPQLNGPKDLIIENQAGVFLDLERILPGVLTISSGSKLSINPLKSLTIRGKTTLNGIDCLIVKSDVTGAGSFIDNGILLGSGTMKAERYLTGYSTNTDLRYHFLSSPVEDQLIQPGFVGNPPDPNSDFYQWSEPDKTWINSKDSYGIWNNGFEPAFNTGKGYLVAYPANGTKSFSGKPNTFLLSAPLVVNCSYTDPVSGGGGGWNLQGNPFPSAIDWNLVPRGSGIDNALYYYDASIENYRYFIPYLSGAAVGNGSQYIPPMQGFMVHANNSGTKTLSFDNSCRVHSGLNIYYKSSSPGSNILTLKAENNHFSDETFLFFTEEATTGFDRLFDAYKLFSFNPSVPQIYSVTPDKTELAVNSLPFIHGLLEIPIGFKPGENGSYRISADGIFNFFEETTINLKDLQTGLVQNLRSDPVYSFTASSSDEPNRFLLQISIFNGLEIPIETSKIHIVSSDKIIYVTFDGDFSGGNVSLYNLEGEQLYLGQISNRQTLSIPFIYIPGVYLVQVIAEGKVYSQKVSVF